MSTMILLVQLLEEKKDEDELSFEGMIVITPAVHSFSQEALHIVEEATEIAHSIGDAIHQGLHTLFFFFV